MQARKDAKAEEPPFVILLAVPCVMKPVAVPPVEIYYTEQKANQRIIHRFSLCLAGFTLISCCGAIAAHPRQPKSRLSRWSKIYIVNNILLVTRPSWRHHQMGSPMRP